MNLTKILKQEKCGPYHVTPVQTIQLEFEGQRVGLYKDIGIEGIVDEYMIFECEHDGKQSIGGIFMGAFRHVSPKEWAAEDPKNNDLNPQSTLFAKIDKLRADLNN